MALSEPRKSYRGAGGARELAVFVLIAGLAVACSDGPAPTAVADRPQLNLARALESATVTSAPAPMSARLERLWTLPEQEPAWSPLDFEHTPWLAAVTTERAEDALRVTVSHPPRQRSMLLIGGLYLGFDDELRLDDWEAVRIRARTRERFAGLTVAYNVTDTDALPGDEKFFFSPAEAPPVFSDGSERTYLIPIHPREDEEPGTRLESLGVIAAAVEPATLDVLSIELVPRGASYLEDSGVRHVLRHGESRSTLFAHAPAAVGYDLEVPAAARLDFGLTTEPGETVRYRVTARAAASSEPLVLFDRTVSESGAWQQHSVDLSSLGGAATELTLEAASDREGSVAFWGAPVVSTSAAAGEGLAGPGSARPNVIFYVIDGGGSDLMSVYGYDRPTTPFLETLAAEATLFERAHSNSTWTQPSTVSFMTSLHHSVLGGLRRGIHSTPVPDGATTMAEHFARAGYLTASFTANPNAGRLIGLERGLDILLDGEIEHHSTSSEALHEAFWRLRASYPGGPWWVHFQTTDVHEPNQPRPPFAGRFVAAGQERQLREWDGQLFRTAGELFGHTSIENFYTTALARSGIDRHAYFDTRRGLYDETMLHQDYRLAELVEGLEESGLWRDTLLVIAADHGHPAGSFARFGRGLLEPQPDPWQGALFDAYSTHVPLLFIWPGRIEGGRRFGKPVSMIDVLPTILELADLPPPEVLQGQSLAPLLTGEEQELRPVILDEFRIDETSGEMIGNLEIIDGRWGASLEIGPVRAGQTPGRGRHAVPVGGRWGAMHPYFADVPSLLLYDLERDPFVTRAVNDEHPELVERYRRLLLEHWQAQRALSRRFAEAGEMELTPEQLNRLRTLGYVQ